MKKKAAMLSGTILILWIVQIIISMVLTKNFRGAYDAWDYWTRGCNIWDGDKVSLLNMQNGARGYVYPLYLGFCYKIGGWNGFLIMNSLLTALFMSLILPRLHGYGFQNGIRCFICYITFGIFFMGLLLYSLSDFFAILLCGIGILLQIELEKTTMPFKKGGLSLLLGAALYMAYNVRTIYLFAGVAVLIRLLVHFYKRKQEVLCNLTSCICVLAGILLAALPQVYMNYHMLGIISIKVPTGGLMLQQVFWGLGHQRYDTYCGPAQNHADPSMHFTDPVGARLLGELGIEEFANWGEFAKFLLRHPVESFGIYVRHFVNMLFPCWPNQYVMNLNNCKIFLAAASLLMFFIFALAALNRLFSGKFLLNYSALLTPIIFITPGAVETRFYAALYIMVIGALCYNLNWRRFLDYVRAQKGKIFICFILYSGLMISIWSAMLASDPCCGIFFE